MIEINQIFENLDQEIKFDEKELQKCKIIMNIFWKIGNSKSKNWKNQYA